MTAQTQQRLSISPTDIRPASTAPAPMWVEREDARLQALQRFDILDTPREEAFDRITRLTRKLFDVPVAIVSFMDAHRQWYKSQEGMANEEVPREQTFCKHVVESGRPLVVPDATKDERFRQSAFVLTEPGVRFYTGIPLATRDSHNIGSLCLIDWRPREFSPEQVDIMSDLAEMAMDELELRLCATRDSLTGALARRAFKEEAERTAALALRHHHDLSCIALDVDYFKSINDTLGHAAGDRVLARLVQVCTEQLRESDRIGRLGGEEFAVLLPNTGSAGAMDAAEKLRQAVQNVRTGAGTKETVTASFGVASLDPSTRDADTLLTHADKALFEAKAAGRNRCVAFRATEPQPAKQRRRVLKAGQILFNGRQSSIDCTVRTLSDEGAGLAVSSSVGVPKHFDLSIKADRFERPCRVVAQGERQIEVEFC